jgi:7-cyano-7-deazaguanine synthase
MCSIVGMLSSHPPMGSERDMFKTLLREAGDRGRDGGRFEEFQLRSGYHATLANWRATPTPELAHGRLQPYSGIVHNGTIANAEQLGLQEGQIDSEILPQILERTSLRDFARSLEKVKGSYAIAAVSRDSVYLACNYKPVYVYKTGGVTYFSSMERHLLPLCDAFQRPEKLEPFTAMDLLTHEMVPIHRHLSPTKVLVIASGGLDSTVAAAVCKTRGDLIPGWFKTPGDQIPGFRMSR